MTKSHQTDRIETQIILRAPIARVWRALTDRHDFGEWFGAELHADLTAGARVTGTKSSARYGTDRSLELELEIERIDRSAGVFSYRWHPFNLERRDYSDEPTTLVELRVEEVTDGTRLTVVESGFDALPAPRARAAFDAHTGGWPMMLAHIETLLSPTDRIEKQIVLRASRDRVWRALSDRREFGAWFGIELRDDFAPGQAVHGNLTNAKYAHLDFTLLVERVDRAAGVLAFRWHPFAMDDKVDYSGEPTTLVELRIAEVAGGTELTVVESGFDALPLPRRAPAFSANSGGWTTQLQNVAKYLAEHA